MGAGGHSSWLAKKTGWVNPIAGPTLAPFQPGMCWLCPAEHLLLWKAGAPLQGTWSWVQLGGLGALPGKGEMLELSAAISTHHGW